MAVFLSSAMILILTAICIHTTNGQNDRQNYYTNWMKTSLNTSKRLLDVILPGSHHAGMYISAIQNNGYLSSTDAIHTNIYSFFPSATNELLSDWSQRQMGSILNQLRAGSRYLDLRLEENGGTIYAHNGLLGATLTTILADIVTYLDESDKSDIIILNFNNFVSISNAETSVFSIVQSSLSAYMQPTANYNLSTDTISQLLSNNINIIPFYDQSSTNLYINDNGNAMLTGTEKIQNGTSTNSIIAHILSELTIGWNAYSQMNTIYYTLSIDTVSKFTKYSNLFDNFLEYNAEIALTLSSTIENYPKLYFGNILIVDFVQASNVVDNVIELNINYESCRDDVSLWGLDNSDCPKQTNLDTQYKNSPLSPACNANPSLLTSCPRSCGYQCPWLNGVPGSKCNDTNLCDSDIYTNAGAVGQCFQRPADSEDFISEKSFCLSPFTAQNCGSVSTDTCGGDGSQLTAGCDEFCSSDFQCSTGYCNTKLGVCLNITTPAPVAVDVGPKECYCDLVISEDCIDFRADIAGFRPGDPDGEYEFVGGATCFESLDWAKCNEQLDENPYIKSLIGFAVIPFILAIVMFVMYSCCCCCWCSCGSFWKRKCCCCLGNTNKSLLSRWIPTILMVCVFGVITWACIQGMTYNSEMHTHLFSANETSVKTEAFDLFESILDELRSIKPELDWIVDNVADISDDIDVIIDSVDGDIEAPISTIENAFNYISSTYSNYSLVTNVTDPFNANVTTVYVPCDYCGGLGAQISEINDTFASATDTVTNMKQFLNDSPVAAAQETINSVVGMAANALTNLTAYIDGAYNDTIKALDDAEPYDEQREVYGNIFFMLPFAWILFWILGVLLGIIGKCDFIGECCFKFTWCPAMFLGAAVMLLFAPFAIISVGWADFCVNLDEFESDPINSNIGQIISSFVGGNQSVNNDSSSAIDVISIVNACWTGSDLLQVLNLSEQLDFDAYRENLSDVLNIEVTEQLQLDELDTFTTEINLLSTDEFEVEGDEYLANLNAVGGNCVCICNSTHGTNEALFTREKLQNGTDSVCYNSTKGPLEQCWYGDGSSGNQAIIEAEAEQGAYCLGNFTLAWLYIQAEQQLITQSQAAIDDIKNQTNVLLGAYDEIFGIAVDIEKSIQNVSCSIDPIFDRFDGLKANYSSWGFLGEKYGNFKEVGCVILFVDMYWISCGMMVIAFLSILVVCFGFMTQYSWHGPKDEEEDDDISDFGSRLIKKTSSRLFGDDFENQMGVEMGGRELNEGTVPATHVNHMGISPAPADFNTTYMEPGASPPPSQPGSVVGAPTDFNPDMSHGGDVM